VLKLKAHRAPDNNTKNLVGRFDPPILIIASARLIVCSTWESIHKDMWFLWFNTT